ncbi:MAG: T9SS type A sorting domain-containing protein [Paludibacter sp.]|nr:T9SS type A sorting domain-containing protein [Paludibacter sp.]
MLAQVESTLFSGNAKINVVKVSIAHYKLEFYFNGVLCPTLDADNPIYLEVAGQKFSGKYSSFSQNGDTLFCSSVLTTSNGTQFSVEDKYISHGSEKIELQRNLNIIKGVLSDRYFNSLFGFQVATNSQLTDNEYFVPGVWYKGNFETECNLPATCPKSTDSCFYYREDRITLPLVMFRNKLSGKVVSLVHKDSDPETVMADDYSTLISANYQFGALGIKQINNTTYETFIYPGSEGTRTGGKGARSHPVRTGITQQYNLMISFSKTDDYASALKQTWDDAFSLYNPKIYNVDIPTCYDGLIETLIKYYVPNIEQGGIRDAPGFPFQVSLNDFLPIGIDYQMGFVGMQIPTGYYVYRYGIENNNPVSKADGEAILNFWANNSLSSLGYPRTWYNPGLNGASGSFRSGSDIRVCTGGMEGLLSAWCFAKKNNISKSYWLKACTRFGDWLVNNQNVDGSFYFSYNHDAIINGKHPVTDYNKYLTICTVRYLTELYIATNNSAYKDAALKAGEFCYTNIHQNYHYIACVIDNPHSYDSESGQMAMNGFLSLYDLTNDTKWLTAAEQAAKYTETWVYSFEIPVENDRTTATSFPRDRSIVGQHLIAISHAAADLGFAWSVFTFYQLYLETGNEHYLQVARMSAHNSKQSMNWDQSLYPGEARGLQLEAFPVMIPRRSNGVETTLNWNYAAHLDPMFRFKDAFGTPDVEAVYSMPKAEQLRLLNIYKKVQSSNYGQNDINGLESSIAESIKIYPNPAGKDEKITIEFSSGNNANLEIYNVDGTKIYGEQHVLSPLILINKKKIWMQPGQYLVRIAGEHFISNRKLIIK